MVGEHRISAAGDPFTSATQREETSLERLLLYACDDCGLCFPRKKLVELDPDRHDEMRFFNGWRLCRSYARRGGVGY
jgi:hypothetical protein